MKQASALPHPNWVRRKEDERKRRNFEHKKELRREWWERGRAIQKYRSFLSQRREGLVYSSSSPALMDQTDTAWGATTTIESRVSPQEEAEQRDPGPAAAALPPPPDPPGPGPESE